MHFVSSRNFFKVFSIYPPKNILQQGNATNTHIKLRDTLVNGKLGRDRFGTGFAEFGFHFFGNYLALVAVGENVETRGALRSIFGFLHYSNRGVDAFCILFS